MLEVGEGVAGRSNGELEVGHELAAAVDLDGHDPGKRGEEEALSSPEVARVWTRVVMNLVIGQTVRNSLIVWPASVSSRTTCTLVHQRLARNQVS